MRLMSFISLFAALWFAYLTMRMPESKELGLYITSMFLSFAFFPKLMQKFAEGKNGKINE